MNISQSQAPDDADRHARRPSVRTGDVRREAVARARAGDRPLRKIADDLDVSTGDVRRWLEDARRREATKDVVVKALVSVIAGALLVYRIYRPHAAIDAVTLGLLALAVLPWLAGIIESANFLGSSIKFRELKATQQQQRADIEALNFVIKRLVTEPEKLHLKKLAGGEPFPFVREDPVSPFLMQELRRLRQMGFIDVTGEQGRGARALEQAGGDVGDHFVIKPAGREYLEFLQDASSPGPAA